MRRLLAIGLFALFLAVIATPGGATTYGNFEETQFPNGVWLLTKIGWGYAGDVWARGIAEFLSRHSDVRIVQVVPLATGSTPVVVSQVIIITTLAH